MWILFTRFQKLCFNNRIQLEITDINIFNHQLILSLGMVMNMYSLLQANGGKISMQQVENSFGGNTLKPLNLEQTVTSVLSMSNFINFK